MNEFLPDHIALPIPLRVISVTPGRVRVRVTRDYREPEILAEIASALTSFVSEIERVKTNPTTGSLTIYYDPGTGDLVNTFVMLQELGIIVNEQPPKAATADRTVIASSITGFLRGWNQRVNELTEGTIDLKSLIPFLLGSWALRQFIKGDARMRIVPWYALAWYAFDTFMKLNKSQTVRPPEISNNDLHPILPLKSDSSLDSSIEN
jgi:hypothetical protein